MQSRRNSRQRARWAPGGRPAGVIPAYPSPAPRDVESTQDEPPSGTRSGHFQDLEDYPP